MASIELGQSKTITVTFRDVNGVATDPSSVQLSLRHPATHVKTVHRYGTNPEIVKASTGVYQVTVTLNEPGDWTYRWEGGGTIVAVDDGVISVRNEEVFP